jgi:hypothetical protein
LDPRTIEVADGPNRGDPAEFTDAALKEFSLTPFPAGYEDGGLSPHFSEIGRSMTPVWGESRLVVREI